MNVSKSAAEMTAMAAVQVTTHAAAQKAGQAAAGVDAAKNNASVNKSAAASASVTVKVAQETRAVAEINMQKVEAVRTAIERGTFKPNPEVIADKLLAGSGEVMKRVYGRT